jgi:hypothetical protein
MLRSAPALLVLSVLFFACDDNGAALPAPPCFGSPDGHASASDGDAWSAFDSAGPSGSPDVTRCTAQLESVAISCTPDGANCVATAVLLDCGARRQIDMAVRDGHPATLCTRDGATDPECLTR